MNKEKIIILGTDNIDKISLGKLLTRKNEDLNLAPIFSSDEKYKDKYLEEIKYISLEEIVKGYKNNAFLYIESDKDNISSGISFDDLDNNDILCMNISNFNNISEITFTKYNFLIIWLDTKFRDSKYNVNNDILETRYLIDKLQYSNYMYFLDEDYDKVSDIILDYIEADEERKKEILENNL